MAPRRVRPLRHEYLGTNPIDLKEVGVKGEYRCA